MSRLFVAIELPDRVKQALSKLKSPIPGAKWVPLEQLHLTLAFLGEVDDTLIVPLCTKLSTIKIPAFDLHVTTTGCFPGLRNPRVVWMGLKPNTHLLALTAAVRESAVACGIPLEERPFTAHITLARFKQPSVSETARFLDQHRAIMISGFSVREFFLYKSQLSSAGAVHTPLQQFDFT